MSDTIMVERSLSAPRRAELGVDGWPVWKDGAGRRTLTQDAAEKSYFLAGEAILTLEGGVSVQVGKGDLVIIPAGACHWEVLADVRRHYRSDALSPACCII
jgi:uncharacterized cupin superfamily protein